MWVGVDDTGVPGLLGFRERGPLGESTPRLVPEVRTGSAGELRPDDVRGEGSDRFDVGLLFGDMGGGVGVGTLADRGVG